jgi:hypothetical protein
MQILLHTYWNKRSGCKRSVQNKYGTKPLIKESGIILVEEYLITWLDTDANIAQLTPYQGFSVPGYISTGTGVKQTEEIYLRRPSKREFYIHVSLFMDQEGKCVCVHDFIYDL